MDAALTLHEPVAAHRAPSGDGIAHFVSEGAGLLGTSQNTSDC
jgi:hypothetical protein